MYLPYRDEVTIYKVTTDIYGQKKTVSDYEVVASIFLQNTSLSQSRNEETISSDAICYLDPTNNFVVENCNRLEGMYIQAPLYESENDDSWYRVTKVIVNRDHLLENQIDNIQLLLKKTTKLLNVS